METLLRHMALAAVVASVLACTATAAEDKSENLSQSAPGKTAGPPLAAKVKVGGSGHRITVGEGDTQIPVVVVRGTPYEMGWHLGRLTRDDIQRLIPATMTRLKQQLGLSDQALQDAWARTAAYSDDRFEQELLGLSDGSGLPLSTLQAVHTIPLLMPYSCSSIAAWGKATEDGHLYQTRNLDWKLAVGAHDFPAVVAYVPTRGIPHVVPTFSGFIGAHTGMNVRGIVLSQMGDSPAKEAPYDVHAPHFTVFFRSLLYDADSLSRALEIFKGLPHTKRYHYVFGDGKAEHRAVKIRAHTPEPPDRRMMIWKDNDPTDEFAPRVLENVVYNDEGRGAYPLLKRDYGSLNAQKMIQIANKIPIRGGNVVNVVYDATALRLWVSYAKGDREAYLRPYTLIDLAKLDADKDGKPDLERAVAGNPAAADFEIATRKAQARVAKTREDTAIFDVECPRGIGSAEITLKSGAWPDTLLVRLHLRGLESFKVSDGTTTVEASVSSHGDHAVRVYRMESNAEKGIERGSPLWTEIKALDVDGKPMGKIPLDKGHFEVTVPKAFLNSQTKTIRLEWIDFYRG